MPFGQIDTLSSSFSQMLEPSGHPEADSHRLMNSLQNRKNRVIFRILHLALIFNRIPRSQIPREQTNADMGDANNCTRLIVGEDCSFQLLANTSPDAQGSMPIMSILETTSTGKAT